MDRALGRGKPVNPANVLHCRGVPRLSFRRGIIASFFLLLLLLLLVLIAHWEWLCGTARLFATLCSSLSLGVGARPPPSPQKKCVGVKAVNPHRAWSLTVLAAHTLHYDYRPDGVVDDE